jgi:glycosyltransferase involved in cell wall biosynthesis
MKNSPFFSIIIPTYKQLNFLKRAINSVFAQTFKDYEIIIIDNNFDNTTKKFLKKLKVKIIYKKIHNQGIIAKSRNLGIKYANGKWISFLDSDDEWTNNKLEETFKEIKIKNIDVICNNEWIVNDSSTEFWSYGPNSKNFYLFMLKYGNLLSTSASSVRKKFLIKNSISFNERREFKLAEDYEFFLNIAKNDGNFKFLSKPLGFHYFHRKNLSNDEETLNSSKEAILKHHIFSNNYFKTEKVKLFSICMSNLVLKRSLLDLREKQKIIKNINNLIFNFFKHPLNFFYYISFLIIKKIINSYCYYNFKNDK